ncbi:conserved hypothetical protein [Xenorhabdus nematophila AN6/1]|nr:conserved hypothetical protein [Xenorhabdus nematophila AN6/1]
MMYTSHLFESYQASFPCNRVTDSGYSGEDLISNLLGFYQAVNNIDYSLQLGIVSKEDALKRWDYYGAIGKYKNKIFRPLLFPDPVKYPNNARPYYIPLPSFLNTISPINDIKTNHDIIHIDDQTGINFDVEYAGITIE